MSDSSQTLSGCNGIIWLAVSVQHLHVWILCVDFIPFRLKTFDSKLPRHRRKTVETCAVSGCIEMYSHHQAIALCVKKFYALQIHCRGHQVSESNRRSIWKFVVIKRSAMRRSAKRSSPAEHPLLKDSERFQASRRQSNRFTWIAFDCNEHHAFWFIQRLESAVCWVWRIRWDLGKMRFHRLSTPSLASALSKFKWSNSQSSGCRAKNTKSSYWLPTGRFRSGR